MERQEEKSAQSRRKPLLTLMFLGPLAVMSSLNVRYQLAPDGCLSGSLAALHLSTIGFAVICVANVSMARRALETSASIDGAHRKRTRWQSSAAIVLSVCSVVGVVGIEVSNFWLKRCG